MDVGRGVQKRHSPPRASSALALTQDTTVLSSSPSRDAIQFCRAPKETPADEQWGCRVPFASEPLVRASRMFDGDKDPPRQEASIIDVRLLKAAPVHEF